MRTFLYHLKLFFIVKSFIITHILPGISATYLISQHKIHKLYTIIYHT